MVRGPRVRKTVAVLGLVLGATAVATIITLSVLYAQHEAPNRPWDQYRLPDTLKPRKYNVTMWPQLTKNEHSLYVFTGHSTVDFECVKETDLILIHSNKLNLIKSSGHHATLTGLGGAVAPTIKTTWLQETTEYLVIQLNNKLEPGKSYQLYSSFTGELADDLEGFYRSEYYEGSELKVLATTQMEATDARKAFPCFDEPALKAIFYMTLIHNRNTVALSNSMAIGSVNTTMGGVEVSVTTFEPTPIMSTYLLAFVVCEYDSIRTPAGAKVLVRVWARRQAIAEGQGDYALEKAASILEYLERYYNVTYPLKKSDQIAVTHMAATAMENWGLVTYREPDLLSSQTAYIRQAAVQLIAHELGHMWFGNLVTMKWWNDVWLNEGFATYISRLVAAVAEPNDDELRDTMLWNDIQRAFLMDAKADSVPLAYPEEEINTPTEIRQLFNTITYNKGAHVLKMFSEFLTEAVFSKGLSNYLHAFAYQNTMTTDLWKHLQAEVDRTLTLKLPGTISQIMNPWVLQMGFPVVTINTSTGTISQKHFLANPESVVERSSIYNYEWFVPIAWTCNGTIQERKWLLSKSDVHKPMKTSEWILANLNVDGFYRVNYDEGNWERLLAVLQSDHKAIPPLNRAQIMDDAFHLAQTNIIDIVLALKTTQYLSKETEYTPWVSALYHLKQHLINMPPHTEVYGAMQKYLKKQLKPFLMHNIKNAAVNRTNWTHWTYSPEFYWLKEHACELGLDGCTDLARVWFREWMNNPRNNTIPADLRRSVYCHVIATGGLKKWGFVWDRMNSIGLYDDREQVLLARGLSCTRDTRLLNRIQQYFLDPSMGHDLLQRIMRIADLEHLQPLLWNYIIANTTAIFNDDGGDDYNLSHIINTLTARFYTQLELRQLLDFKAALPATGFNFTAEALHQAIERTETRGKWMEENQEKMVQWLTSAAR
ncbi:aminopeptidase Ey-like [Alosa alosa]|uniref:aminopeptidase Ey-like n=1 Tax=Alosa alosa TaxID=278164 RepID=UPI0020155126|nr:aminopeptidase Ey-like [Alosa alosa]